MRGIRRSQQGITIIEFTLIAFGLFVLMFFAFEIGRYMFSMQMLNEMTRKAARLAVVCSISDQQDIVTLPEVLENRPIGFTDEHLKVSYVDSDGVEVPTNGYSSMSVAEKRAVFSRVRYVRTEVVDFRFQFFPLLSFIGDGGAVSVPEFVTILPVESLGVVRPNTGETAGVIEDC
ncbi:TadE/TadG family type IV pilus assembly protein [Vibrio hangzhouensis]|uniref:TadE/TadG family type IV pilus assembly protein n=1 Tax=Vibrio hangzhouensis TaxID=462991 RepID=UPI001C986DD7|nr:TadE/TadG family type IV pilus assembly protein [Vibrio hangzhouensis]MBY6196600.1 pilus assembly protein [Vibrio hangzhouensis]